jgi:transcriptional regulator with XRE-family HTH domain
LEIQELGKRVYQLRTEKGYTQTKLAELANVSQQTIKRLEVASVNTVKPGLLTSLAYYLDCTVDYLKGESDDRGKNKDGTVNCVVFNPQFDLYKAFRELYEENPKYVREFIDMSGRISSDEQEAFRQIFHMTANSEN